MFKSTRVFEGTGPRGQVVQVAQTQSSAWFVRENYRGKWLEITPPMPADNAVQWCHGWLSLTTKQYKTLPY